MGASQGRQEQHRAAELEDWLRQQFGRDNIRVRALDGSVLFEIRTNGSLLRVTDEALADHAATTLIAALEAHHFVKYALAGDLPRSLLKPDLMLRLEEVPDRP